MPPTIPPKLREGDEVRVVAPSRSLAMIDDDVRDLAVDRLESLGLEVTFGEHVAEVERWTNPPVDARVADLHAAFEDPDVKAILTVIGGFNVNQILDHLDFDLVASNPTILCGYSDITALQHALLARSDLVTYSGPHFSTFGMRKGNAYTLEHFRRCLFRDPPLEVHASDRWSDDRWFLDQEDRTFHDNPGPWTLREGTAEGRLLGGNLCTLNLLQGTDLWPGLDDALLLLEDDAETDAPTFDRDLQSLLHQPGADGIRGIGIGRFQRASDVDARDLAHSVRTKTRLPQDAPVAAGLDLGHTSPMFTFPVGGRARLEARDDEVRLEILEH